ACDGAWRGGRLASCFARNRPASSAAICSTDVSGDRWLLACAISHSYWHALGPGLASSAPAGAALVQVPPGVCDAVSRNVSPRNTLKLLWILARLSAYDPISG